MTIGSTTSNSLASLLSSTLNNTSGTGGGSSGSSSITGSPISTGPIDVNTLVSELMTVESQPLTQLQSKESGVQSKISAYGQVQSALSDLDTALVALQSTSAFKAAQATVSGSGVSATVSGAPAAGSYSVTVSQLAQAQAAASGPLASGSTAVGTGTLTIQLGTYNTAGNTFTAKAGSGPVNITIDPTNNTLSGIASAINGAAAGVTASIVSDNSGSRLVLSSSSTGAANAFRLTVADADGNNSDVSGLSQLAFDPTASAGAGKNLTATQQAMDAQYSVNGLSLVSSSNTVTTAVSGLTLNLNEAPAAGSPPLQSQITVGTDSTAVGATVNNFVQAYNKFQSLAKSLSNYNSTTNTAAVLNGEGALRSMSSQLQAILGGQMSAAAGDYTWLSQVGIDFQKDGSLSLNSSTFSAALSADPAKVARLFTTATGTGSQQGFVTQLANSVETMLAPDGLLGDAQSTLQSDMSRMQTQAASMQAQLTQTQNRLIAEYSKLNADMVTAQQQQVSLANALSGLPAA
jgi:flagellar hook-associated protein 2